MQPWRQGTVERAQRGGGKRSALASHAGRVRGLLGAEPDLTIAELRDRLTAAGIHTSPAAISRFLTSEDLTPEKRPGTQPSRNDRTSPRPESRGGVGKQR
jgi:transposase